MNKLNTPETYDTYQVTIGGKFGPLLELSDTDTETEKMWEDIKSCFKETAEEVLGTKKPQQEKPWLTAEVLELSNERSKGKQPRLDDPTKKPRYNFFSREIKRKSKECKEAWLQNLCKEAELANYSKKAKQVYSSIKTITGTKPTSIRSVKNKDGEVLTDDERIKDRWKENYEDLYNQPNPKDTSILQILLNNQPSENEPVILRSEVQSAIKRLKGNKAAGDD